MDSSFLVQHASRFFFTLLVLITLIPALLVALTTNIVRAACWLLLSLSGAAGLFFFLGADFVGATQLLIYVGGTLVLVIFGVMLTATGPFVKMNSRAGDWVLALFAGGALLGALVYGVTRTAWPQGPIYALGESHDDHDAGGHVAGHAEPAKANALAPAEKQAGKAKSHETSKDAAHDDDHDHEPARTGLTASTHQIGLELLGIGPSGQKGHAPAADDGTAASHAHRKQSTTGYLLPFEIISVHLVVVLIGAAYLARAKRKRAKES